MCCFVSCFDFFPIKIPERKQDVWLLSGKENIQRKLREFLNKLIIICVYMYENVHRRQKMRREASHMAAGCKWLYCLGKLITLSIDIYEPAGVQTFTC